MVWKKESCRVWGVYWWSGDLTHTKPCIDRVWWSRAVIPSQSVTAVEAVRPGRMEPIKEAG